MIQLSKNSGLPKELDDFLLTPIGEGRNGLSLSVLSAFARLGIDPWEEALRLRKLPRQAALQRLTALIGSLPDEPSIQRNSGSHAERLTAILQRVKPLPGPSETTAPEPGFASLWVAAAPFMWFLSFTVFLFAVRHLENATPPATSNHDKTVSARGMALPATPKIVH